MSNRYPDKRKIKVDFFNPNSEQCFEAFIRSILIEKILNTNENQLFIL